MSAQEAYQAYEQHFRDSPPAVLRDCLELKSDLDPISIDEVQTCAPLSGECGYLQSFGGSATIVHLVRQGQGLTRRLEVSESDRG